MESEEDEICVICLSSLKSGENIYKLECNHSFHTDCIINWFRKSHGKCPCCMDYPISHNMVYEGFSLNSLNHNYINNRYNVVKKHINNSSNESSKKKLIK